MTPNDGDKKRDSPTQTIAPWGLGIAQPVVLPETGVKTKLTSIDFAGLQRQ
jgi:hypothetical protein